MFTDTPLMTLMTHALDATLMREQAIASNIAHSKTQGYQSLRVSFEDQLTQCSEQDLASLAAVNPVYQSSKEPIALDNELALNVTNGTQFKALIKGVNFQLTLMKIALQGSNNS